LALRRGRRTCSADGEVVVDERLGGAHQLGIADRKGDGVELGALGLLILAGPPKRRAEQPRGVGIAGRGAQDLARLRRRQPRILAQQPRRQPQRLGHGSGRSPVHGAEPTAMFTDMKEGTAEDWAHIAMPSMASTRRAAAPADHGRPGQARGDRGRLRRQPAHPQPDGRHPRPPRGASDEEVVAALCHDLGKLFSIPNHGPIAAEMLKPYVSRGHLPRHLLAPGIPGPLLFRASRQGPRRARALRGESWFGFAEKLVDDWDGRPSIPASRSIRLESFEPEVDRVFSNPRAMI
jgi:hypothetical protein